MGPSAMRLACVSVRISELGHLVRDAGNLHVPDRASIEAPAASRERRAANRQPPSRQPPTANRRLPAASRQPPEGGHVDYMPAIAEVCAELASCTAQALRDGETPLVLGGDHSLAAGSVAGVATAMAERRKSLGLIWIDAHSDINTPESSLSGNVHGMPVAHLLGMGDPRLARLSKKTPAIRPEHLVFVGLRDVDAAEKEIIRRMGLRAFTMRDIDERGLRAVVADAIEVASRGTGGFYVSCDADWVDPSYAPGVGTAVRGGATLREAHLAMEMIHDSGLLRGMDLVEINPILDSHNQTAELSVALIASAFGRRIL
jgi:arginase